MEDINLGDDFYTHINKTWLDNTLIPPEYTRWGSFNILKKDTEKKLLDILQKGKSSKLTVLFNQSMTDNKDMMSIKLLNIFINYINTSYSNISLFRRVMKISLVSFITLPLDISIEPDYNNSNMNILHISSGGLGLPDRDYYFLTDKEEIRNRYLEFIEEYVYTINSYMSKPFLFFIEQYVPIISINPTVIFKIEKMLAEKTFTKVQKRDPIKQNNVIDWDSVIISYPNLGFIHKLFKSAKVEPGKINICNKEYCKTLDDMIDNIPMENWKQYFIFKLILKFNDLLNIKVLECHFNFYNKILLGNKILHSIEIRKLHMVEKYMGEMLGIYYSIIHLNIATKEYIQKMIDIIKTELEIYLNTNTWMTEKTKTSAIEKLDKMKIKIGMPTKIKKNYKKLDIKESYPYISNILRIKKFNMKYELKKLYKNVDRDEWHMNSYEVNAYYNPNMNEIVFPAGILQKPLFSLEQNAAQNFGGIGVVIGHEIIHGFDDEGCKYDKDGNLKNWWEESDYIKYKMNTNIIINQYNKYTVEGKNINGELTNGENIADIGGVGLSFKAYQKYIQNNNTNTGTNIDFFTNFANVWKSKSTKEHSHNAIISDPHSDPKWRVNGSLANIMAFYEAFNIKPSDKMWIAPENRANIWGNI
jgi:putative endopeptidase